MDLDETRKCYSNGSVIATGLAMSGGMSSVHVKGLGRGHHQNYFPEEGTQYLLTDLPSI
jgi:hypothetical protein